MDTMTTIDRESTTAAASAATSAGDEVRVHEIPETVFFYHPCRVTHDDLNEAVADVMLRLLELTQARRIAQTGNLLLVYRGNTRDEDDSFDLWIGLPVLQGTPPIEGFAVTRLPAFRCAASVHVGASRDIGETYGCLIEMIRGQGLEPTGEVREEYLHWEGRTSDHDITWVQVGVRSRD
jgi:effector-binding domain-containing protein